MGQVDHVDNLNGEWENHGKDKQSNSSKWELSMDRDSVGIYLGFKNRDGRLFLQACCCNGNFINEILLDLSLQFCMLLET